MDDDDDAVSTKPALHSYYKSAWGNIDENTPPRYYGENAPLDGLPAPHSHYSTRSPAALPHSPFSPIHLNHGMCSYS